MKRNALFTCAAAALLVVSSTAATAAEGKLKVLILDGQNNHNWKQTTPVLKWALESSERFTVDVATREKDKEYKPAFKDYAVVVSNYNGERWPKETEEAFIEYVKNGGGFVCIHAANNSFGNWDEYNKMIGLGGWGGRNEKSGPYVYYRDGKIIRDMAKGNGGSHGAQHPFTVTILEPEHPITKGLPSEWLHAQDELYDRLRGPAENMKVLATSFSDPKKGGRGENEPMMMVLEYGKGRVYHTPMGHADYSMKCVGFVVTLQRGTEWAAIGKVTLTKVPEDFPTKEKTSSREVK
ncbi:MAG: ThuA domain-containing protein [Phycisphaeraceae bacterium]